MLFNLLFSLVITSQNQQIFHLTFSYMNLIIVHDRVVDKFFNFIENKKTRIETNINSPWLKITDKNELFDNLYDWFFDEDFFINSTPVIKIYSDCFKNLKKALSDSINETQNINALSNSEYINLFYDKITSLFQSKIKSATIDNYQDCEINVLVKHFLKQKPILKYKGKKGESDLIIPLDKISLENLITENNIRAEFRQSIFFDPESFINQIKTIIEDTRFKNKQKIIILNISSDIYFLIYFYTEGNHYDILSLKEHFQKMIKKLQNNIIDLKKFQNDIDEFKDRKDVIFQISKFRSDFLPIFFDFIKSRDQSTVNFTLEELTDMIFGLNKEILNFLREVFAKKVKV